MSHQLPSMRKHKTVGGTPPYYARVYAWAYDDLSGMRTQVVRASYGPYASEIYANAVAEALDRALGAGGLLVDVVSSENVVVPRPATPDEAAADWETRQ